MQKFVEAVEKELTAEDDLVMKKLSKKKRKMNLLNILGENKKHLPTMLLVLRILNILAIIALIYFGWNVFSGDVRYTNPTSFVVWVIWWPMIIFMVLLAGRLWCTMCHLKLIADCLDGFGLKLKVPKWIMKRGTTITVAAVLAIFILHSSVEELRSRPLRIPYSDISDNSFDLHRGYSAGI